MARFFESFKATSRVACAVGALALAAGAVPMSAALAQAAPEGISIVMADAEGTSSAATAEALMAKAQEQGEIRLIIGVDAGFTPEGSLSAAAAASQRAAIAAGQAQVMSAVSAPTGVRQYESIPYMAMTVTPADLARVLSAPGVTFVQEDVAVPPTLSQSVPLVDGPDLWRRGGTGDGTIVAILDTGVRPDHVAFRDPGGRKIVGSACFSSNTSIANTVCPNGNERQVNNRGASAGKNCSNSISGCDHGTHVAGIAAGFQRGNHGMAKGADIFAVQVFSEFPTYCGSTPCALSYTSDQISGLEQVLKWRQAGRNVVSANMSLGGGRYTDFCDSSDPARKAIIDNLLSAGVATVIASGNNGFDDSVGGPACISSAVTVGSTTKTDGMSSFSNHDEMVDILAPGSSIVAPNAAGGRQALTTKSGTSMATPHVAGAFGMLMDAVPGATPHEVERALKCTGVQIQRANTPKPRISMLEAFQFLKNPHTRKVFLFRQASQVSKFTDILGNWIHVSAQNAMRVVANQSHIWYLTQAPFCANDIRVAATLARKAPDADFSWNSGIVLSSTASSDGKMSGLFFAYRVSPSDVTSVNIWQFAGYDGVADTGEAVSLCSNSFNGPALGAKRRLVATKDGNNLTFMMDGSTVCTASTDARFTDGHAGIMMAAPANTTSHRLVVSRVILQALTQSTSPSVVSASQPGDTGMSGESAQVAAMTGTATN
ncbi:MAG: S8 family serine peptidase [Roseovarius sp.]